MKIINLNSEKIKNKHSNKLNKVKLTVDGVGIVLRQIYQRL